MATTSSSLSIIFGLFLILGVAVSQSEARAFFVFGDSLVDSGNNNYLATTARADSPPYGIDYPTRRATGRFSNGYNIPDLISQQIGSSESPLPYLSPELTGQRLLVGANFASAGIGILQCYTYRVGCSCFYGPIDFNSNRIVLFRTWSKSAFSQITSSIKLSHFKKSLIGGASPVEISLFPLSTAHSEQLLLGDQYRRPYAIST